MLYSLLALDCLDKNTEKQLTPLTVYILKYIIHRRKSVLSIPLSSELSRFAGGTALNASSTCLPSLFEVRRYKDKNYLAKNVQCELFFLQKYAFFM